MFIDIHAHAVRLPDPSFEGKSYNMCTAQQLLDIHDRVAIEKAVLLPVVNPEAQSLTQSNDDIIEMAEAYNDRFIPFCNVDPRAVDNSPNAPLGRLLGYYKDKGVRGLGEICANLPFLDPMVQNLFRHCSNVGFPVTFHIGAQIGGVYGLYDDPGLPQLEYSLNKFPKLKFFGHSQAFWAEIGRLDKPGDRYFYPDYPIREEGVVPRLMRQYSNLYGDLSAGSGYNAVARDREYGVAFLNEFQDRLFFGTDICDVNQEPKLVDYLLDLRKGKMISEEVFLKVARENAVRILNLES